MDFALSEAQQSLQRRCLELAADFATRSTQHDRDASHPVENYVRLRAEGFLSLTIDPRWGGAGASFLDHTIAYEALGQGCPSTALSFNMHASVVMPVLQSRGDKRRNQGNDRRPGYPATQADWREFL